MKMASKEIFYGLLIELFGIIISYWFSNREQQLIAFSIVTALAWIIAFGNIQLEKLRIQNPNDPKMQAPYWGVVSLGSIAWGFSLSFIFLLELGVQTLAPSEIYYAGLTQGELEAVLFLFWGLSASIITRQVLKSVNIELRFDHVFILFVGWGGGLGLAQFLREDLSIVVRGQDFIQYQHQSWFNLLPLFGIVFGSIMTGIALHNAENSITWKKIFVVMFGWIFSCVIGYLIVNSIAYQIDMGAVFSNVILFFLLGTIIGFIGNAIMINQLSKTNVFSHSDVA